MERRLHPDSEMSGHHGLSNAVSDSGNAEHSCAATMLLGDLHRSHRRGKYVPDDIRFQILYRLPRRSDSKSAMDCPSTPGAP
ncbi:hypothetical protein EES39_31090 [Streptomyces sp. ADI92-24]|nr:hypothetical protein EES39_31090 [Streptomyces sp. ADI92-24]